MKNVLLMVFSLFLISCDNEITAQFQTIAIKDIITSPIIYSGEDIIVEGYASETTKTPILSMYKLTDETGSIWVQTKSFTPQENKHLYIRARIDNVFSFRKNSIGLHLVELEKI